MDSRDDRPSSTRANGYGHLAAPRDEEIDALADLFLGGERAPSGSGSPATRTARRRRVEGLVLGHLPAFASAWPAQYARRCADSEGTLVVLVRLTSGVLSVDYFGEGAAETPEREDALDALADAGALAGLVLLRVDEPAEAELAPLEAIEGLRLLSGTDDAAVVGCYRKLKGLAVAAEEAGTSLPDIGLALVGVAPDRAAGVHERIARAARAFLEEELLEPVVVERAGRTGSRCSYRGTVSLSLAEVASALDRPVERQADAAPMADPSPGPKDRVDHGSPSAGVARGPDEPALVSAEGSPREGSTGGSLVSLIGGLRLLESRCPGSERVELALDSGGRLHLVAGRLADHPGLSSMCGEADLLRVAAWARANRDVLGRAERAVLEGEPVLHLVTDRREDARRLLGTPVRAHLAVAARPNPLGLVAVSLDDASGEPAASG